MSIAVGSVTVADDGSRTGSGYSLALYDVRAALIANPYPSSTPALTQEQRTHLVALLPTYEAGAAVGAPFPLTATQPPEIDSGTWARLLAAGMVRVPESPAVARLEALRGVATGSERSAAEIIPYLLANGIGV